MRRLLWSNKSKINKDTNGENVLNIEITELVLVHCSFVNNQQDSRVLYSFIPNKSFDQLLDISVKTFIFFRLLI